MLAVEAVVLAQLHKAQAVLAAAVKVGLQAIMELLELQIQVVVEVVGVQLLMQLAALVVPAS
jgi:hypothetical protein